MTLLVLGYKSGLAGLLEREQVDALIAVTSADLAAGTIPSALHDFCVCVPDLRDPSAILGTLQRRGLDGSVHAVHTQRELAVVSAALVASELEAAGMTVRTALACRDKAVQKRLLRAAGLPCADQVVFEPPASKWAALATSLDPVALPGVLKPVAGGGSRGASVVQDTDGLVAALAAAEGGDAQVLESFITGAELHCDGYVTGGRLGFLSVSRYGEPVLSVRAGRPLRSHVVGDAEPALLAAARTLTDLALAALGVADSVFHLEAFDTPAGLVFSEVAARPGGGFVTQAVEARHGVELRHAALRIALGRPPEHAAPARTGSVGFTFLPAPAGRVDAVPDLAELAGLPGVLRVDLQASVGDTMADMTQDSAKRLGLVLCEADDDAMLHRRLDAVVDLSRERTSVLVGATG